MVHDARRSNFHIKQIFFGIALVMVLFMFLVPDAMACHRGDPPKPHGKTASCDDPGPGPNPNPPPPLTSVATILALDGEVISDVGGGGRSCNPGNLSVTAGDYTCDTQLSPSIRINTHKYMTGVFSKKDRDICMALDSSKSLQPALNGFQYGWVDSCFEDSCSVEIRIVAEGAQVGALSGGKSDLLDIVMHASVDPSGDSPANSNPFFHSRDVEITSVDLDYKRADSTRSLATCTFYTTPLDTPVASMVSEPISN
jgi:hypothetical protein